MRTKHRIIVAVACVVVVLAGVSAWLYWTRIDTSQQQKAPAPVQKDALHVFFPLSKTKLGQRSVEVRADTPDKERADLILKELKKEKSLNTAVQLRDIAVGIDGVLYLNLSRHVTEAQPGTPSEILIVYSLVNSFATSFKEVRKVQLLVEGEPVYTVAGLVYTFVPLEFNKELMED